VRVGQAQPEHPIAHDVICQKFLQTKQGKEEKKERKKCREGKWKVTAKGFSGAEASAGSR